MHKDTKKRIIRAMNHSEEALKTLLSIKKTVEAEISEIVSIETKKIQSKYPQHLVDTFKLFTKILERGGKRVRAALVLQTHDLLHGNSPKEALKLGALIEFIQAYLLMIDDYIDKSKTRRGGPAAHKISQKYLKEKYNLNNKHLSNSFAVLAGNLGNHIANRLISEMEIPNETKIKILNNLNALLETTYFGEMADVYGSFVPNTTEKDTLNMLRWKTSTYTFQNPMQMGAILAQGSDRDLQLIAEYAIPTGTAFQIQDDILGVFGNSKDTGKPNLDDLKEGKMTLLVTHCLNHAKPEQIKILKSGLGNKKLSEKDLQKIREILIECGSYDYARQIAQQKITEAQKILDSDETKHWNQKQKDFLYGTAEYIVKRKS